MKVTLSGTSFDALSGGGLFQVERPEIAAAFTCVRSGFGHRCTAELTREQAERLFVSLDGAAALLLGPGLDPGDTESRAEGRALDRDADRLALALELPRGWRYGERRGLTR